MALDQVTGDSNAMIESLNTLVDRLNPESTLDHCVKMAPKTNKFSADDFEKKYWEVVREQQGRKQSGSLV